MLTRSAAVISNVKDICHLVNPPNAGGTNLPSERGFVKYTIAQKWVGELPKPRIDIQTALRIIARRSDRQRQIESARDPSYTLDLRSTNLRGVDLVGWHLEEADFRKARMEGVNLFKAHLESAKLLETRLEGAFLASAHLEGAKFFAAHLEMALLADAHLEGTSLSGAHLEGAELSGAYFDSKTRLTLARLRGAGLSRISLTRITNADFAEAYGDGSVQLPGGFTAGVAPLAHWASGHLDPDDFDSAWRKWQAEHHPDLLPEGYDP